MGHVLNYTMGDVLTHLRRRSGWRVLRPMGFDSFGLPAENAAIREGGHPREITEHYIEVIRDADEAARVGDRLGPRGLGARGRLLQVDAVALPPLLRARPRLPEGGAGQLVPERPDGGRERVRDRRPLRALRREGRGAEPRAVVLQDHGLRRRAARVRPAARPRLARAHEDDPAQLDRPLGGRRAPASASTSSTRTCPSSRRGPTRSSARRSSCSRPSTRSSSGSQNDEVQAYATRDGREARRGARGRGGEDGSLHRPPRDEPGHRRADPDLGRRLRADGVRHRRDHGRARPRRARPGVRGDVRPADRRGDLGGGHARQLRTVRRPARRGGEDGDRRVAGRAGTGEADRLLPPARLELLAAALLGLPDPDRLLRRLRDGPRARRRAARAPARRRGLPAEGRAAARLQHRVAPRALSRSAASRGRARRTRWTRSSTRPGTSSATSTPTTTRRRSGARSSTTGARSTSTSAASTTRRGTCSTRASSSR